jgi:arylsulfatase A-like enzyme
MTLAALLCAAVLPAAAVQDPQPAPARPNILLAIADDWGWPHAGALGDRAARTPTFDALAADGVHFRAAFVSSPSCTPSRNAILTGQHFFRLGEGANLWSTLPPEHRTFPDLLAAAGYHVGHVRKAWGPGDWRAAGRETDPAGPGYPSFAAFLDARPDGAPFCFWFGSSDPHRPYDPGSGAEKGIDLDAIVVPPPLPDVPAIRADIADHHAEVERFDAEVGEALELLRGIGEFERTLVAVTGDHGWPFPRGKTNLYDLGTRVPLVLRHGAPGSGRPVDALVSLIDLAPTFVEAAGLPVPGAMTGRSLWPWLRGDAAPPTRGALVLGRERHTVAQDGHQGGYPMRAIRTPDHLYIRNFRPEDWPAGYEAPGGRPFRDCDNGPTKTWLLAHRDEHAAAFELCFGRRPAEELYDLAADPWQVRNLADDPEHEATRAELAARLEAERQRLGDPRRGAEVVPAFDRAPMRR